jgi:ABC-2 type transport system permease protein
MLELIRIEWLKLKNYRTFWILTVLYLVSIFGINYIVFKIQETVYSQREGRGVAEMIIGVPPYSFPAVWQMTSFVTGFLLFLPGLLMIISMTNEYSYKTHRQNIIDGWSRSQFIGVKIALAVMLSIISTLMVMLTSVFFGLQHEPSFSFEKIQYLLFFFIRCLSYCMVALLFAIFFKRGGLAIGVFFLYSIVIENLLALLMNRYAGPSGRFLPLETSDNLIPLPAFENMTRAYVEETNPTALVIVALVYLALYVFVIRRKFQTDDL